MGLDQGLDMGMGLGLQEIGLWVGLELGLGLVSQFLVAIIVLKACLYHGRCSLL